MKVAKWVATVLSWNAAIHIGQYALLCKAIAVIAASVTVSTKATASCVSIQLLVSGPTMEAAEAQIITKAAHFPSRPPAKNAYTQLKIESVQNRIAITI